MTAQFHGAVATASNTPSTSGLASSVGDRLFAWMAADDATPWNVLSGWVQRGAQVGLTLDGEQVALMELIGGVTGALPGTFGPFTGPSGDTVILLFTVSGCSLSTASTFITQATNNSASAYPVSETNSGGTAGAGDLIISLQADDSQFGAGSFTMGTSTASIGTFTQRNFTVNGFSEVSLSTLDNSASGATGTVTTVSGGTGPGPAYTTIVMAIPPASSGAPTPLSPTQAPAARAISIGPPQPRSISGSADAPSVAAVVRAARTGILASPTATQPSLGAGDAAAVARVVAPTVAPVAGLPPAPALRQGTGDAAQVAVLTRLSSPASPVELPPRPSVAAGAGDAAAIATITRPNLLPPSADLPPTDRVLAGAGVVPTVAVVARPTLLPPLGELPFPGQLRPGAGDASAPAAVVQFSLPTSAVLPPSPRLTPGTGDAAPVASVLRAPPASSFDLPPQTRLLAGVPPVVVPTSGTVSRAVPADLAGLPPQPSTRLGSGQAASVASVARSASVGAFDLPPTPRLIAGAGQPSQGWATTAPFVLPSLASLPPAPSTHQGSGVAAAPATLTRAPAFASPAELPAHPELITGAVAAPPVVLVLAIAIPQSAELPARARLVQGVPEAPATANAPIRGWFAYEALTAPPRPSLLAGGQEPPPLPLATIVRAPILPPLAELPPDFRIIVGANGTIVVQSGAVVTLRQSKRTTVTLRQSKRTVVTLTKRIGT